MNAVRILACLMLLAGCAEPRNDVGDANPAVRNSPGNPASQPHESTVDLVPVEFRDVTRQAGIELQLPEQPRPMRTLESFGCGCAAFDFDNDGWQDLLVVTDPYPTLYRNRGNGTFEDATASTGLNTIPAGNWTGCAVGDTNADGWLDLLISGYRGLCLCHNIGGTAFRDVTADGGLDPQNHGHWGAGAGLMDLDGDQLLDLVVLNYVVFDESSQQFCEAEHGHKSSCPPRVYPAEFGEIWRNAGGRRFERVPDENGMQTTSGIGLVLAFTDLDLDGRCDFYIGNDARNADLMYNLGGMRFENEALPSGLAVNRRLLAMAAMGADWGDFDRDGLLDLTVTDFQDKGAALFRNLGQRLFTDCSDVTGIEAATVNRLGFGVNWLDFENDGWLDVTYVNGHVNENVSDWRKDVAYRQPLTFMRNQAGRRFQDITKSLSADVQRPIAGRGSASLDFDNDGRLDLLIVDYEGPPLLLQNLTESNHHWLKISLRGKPENPFAWGARITARTGPLSFVDQVSPSSSYMSSKDPRLHMGLGTAKVVEELTVHWPDGTIQTITGIAADQILEIRQAP